MAEMEVLITPNIRPISDLRNNFNEIANICHAEQEPVFITKNGYGDLVIMSLDTYEAQQAQMELYRKLGEAEEQVKNAPLLSHDELFGKLGSVIISV